MVYIEISDASQTEKISQLNNHLSNGSVFLLIYMEGCGPCNMTRPEWKKMADSPQTANKIIAAVVNTAFSSLVGAGESPVGFPTIRFIHDGRVDEYNKERGAESLLAWVSSQQKGGRKMRRKYSTRDQRRRGIRTRSKRRYKRSTRHKRSMRRY